MRIFFEDVIIKNKFLVEAGNIDIPLNKLTVIKGNNGSGKTLLARQIFFTRSEEYRDIVYVDQSSYNIIEDISLEENISLGNLGNNYLDLKKQLSNYGVIELAEHKANELSGGEKRLISLIRGFAATSKYLILDEPTNELDHEMVEKVINVIKNELVNKTIVCITHDDRIEKIADEIYEISEKKIKKIKSVDGNYDSNNGINVDEKAQTSTLEFKKFNKLFKNRWASYLLIILIVATTIFSLEYIDNSYSNEIQLMENNQLDIFVPTAEYATKPSEGAIPIEFFKIIDGSISIRQATEVYNKALTEAAYKGITFGLYTPTGIDNEIYIIEVYDVKGSNEYLLPEIYMNIMHDTSLSIDKLDTTSYFELSNVYLIAEDGYIPKEYKLNIDEYNAILLDLTLNVTPDYIENQHIILSLSDENSFDKFFGSEYFTSISSGNYYLRSNETIMIYNSIQSFKDLGTVAIMMFLLLIFCVIVEIVFDILYFKEHKRKLRILINNGASKMSITKVLKNKYNQSLQKIIIIIIVIAFGLLRYTNYQSNTMIYLILLFFTIIMLILETISILIKKNKVNKHFNWRFR